MDICILSNQDEEIYIKLYTKQFYDISTILLNIGSQIGFRVHMAISIGSQKNASKLLFILGHKTLQQEQDI